MLASAVLSPFQTPALHYAANRRRIVACESGRLGRHDVAWSGADTPAVDSRGGMVGAGGGTARYRMARYVRA